MLYHLFANRYSFFKEIEKISSNISFAELLIRNAVADPKVSIGVEPEVVKDFFETLKRNKDLSFKTTDIRLKFKECQQGILFKGYKLTFQGAVVAYFAYSEQLKVMYTLTFDTGYKQFFTLSLFKNSYKLPGILEEKGTICVGLGVNESKVAAALLHFIRNLSLSSPENEVVVDSNNLKLPFPNAALYSKFLYQFLKYDTRVIAIENILDNVFVTSDAGVGLEQPIKKSSGGILNYNEEMVGYYEYEKGHLATLIYFTEEKDD